MCLDLAIGVLRALFEKNLAIGRKAPHVSLSLFNLSRDHAGRHRDRNAALRVASTGRSR